MEHAAGENEPEGFVDVHLCPSSGGQPDREPEGLLGEGAGPSVTCRRNGEKSFRRCGSIRVPLRRHEGRAVGVPTHVTAGCGRHLLRAWLGSPGEVLSRVRPDGEALRTSLTRHSACCADPSRRHGRKVDKLFSFTCHRGRPQAARLARAPGRRSRPAAGGVAKTADGCLIRGRVQLRDPPQ